MANPHRGEVAFKVGTQEYILRYSTNAIIEMEDALGLGVNEIGAALANVDKMRMKTVRTVFWAGLRSTPSQRDLTEESAGELMTEFGLLPTMQKVSEAFGLAFPDADEKQRPPMPGSQDGTGPAS